MTGNPVGSVANEMTDALVERLFLASVGMFDVLAVHVGDRLGLYKELRDGGPATPSELAQRCQIDRRYAREWLEQQAASGILEVEDASAPEDERVFALPAGHAEALTDPDSDHSIAPLARSLVASALAVPKVIEAFRTGEGIGWDEYGDDMIEAQGDFNRPWLKSALGTQYLPAIEDIHARLQADPPAKVADFACGVGWAAIAIAQAYPKVEVHGYDLDDTSISLARKFAAEAGVGERVSFEVQDIADTGLAGAYDLCIVVEAIHDLAKPVEALASIKRILATGGSALIADERVAETFSPPADEVERLFYGYSVFVCLPAGRSEEPSAATGTVMRASTMEQYAREAGFSQTERLDLDHDFLQFYRLRP